MTIDGLRVGQLLPAEYHAAWRRARAAFLAEPKNAVCRDCRKRGRLTPTTEVHHDQPHRGDPVKFWDRSIWVGLRRTCHSRITMAEMRQRYGRKVIDRPGAGADGYPPPGTNHPWNRR